MAKVKDLPKVCKYMNLILFYDKIKYMYNRISMAACLHDSVDI